MAMTNRERVEKGLDLVREGVSPYVVRELEDAIREGRVDRSQITPDGAVIERKKQVREWDVSLLLGGMKRLWNPVFGRSLGRSARTLVFEMVEWRNLWAHQENFSGGDTERALDTASRLLDAVEAPEQATEARQLRADLLAEMSAQSLRNEKKKKGGSLLKAASEGRLKPWREVITPHADVREGRYRQAEFMADLWEVKEGRGTTEYRNPRDFFHRTFLTESLRRLLLLATRRLSGGDGDPVVQLQTNFGGGKTHSMLALYHLFSSTPVSDLPGVDDLLSESEYVRPESVRRVVLVGNKLRPGTPEKKPDGTVVHTLWGEMAHQIGGRDAYELVRDDDERATNPGDALSELFRRFGPVLILIDEWVSYARQLPDGGDLPGGSFETQFTFAQTLTEAAKSVDNALLVVSLPASSDGPSSPHAVAEDTEVGGIRGRDALARLQNVVGRVEASWQPATSEESFEIVRRRLFDPLPGHLYKERDLTARAFIELYSEQAAEFPSSCRESDYERRIRASYPIHPEVFDRLYGDWSTLPKFQRTRGVLRLMAGVVASLWDGDDPSPLILPGSFPMDDEHRCRNELTRYLEGNWTPIIEMDVDGPSSTSQQVDNRLPNLGKWHAARRVARTVCLGSAPLKAAKNRGLDDRQVKLGCVLPGENPTLFGDALRRLAAASTYLYEDGAHYWYDTQATVAKLAADRAATFVRNQDRLDEEVRKRVRASLGDRGEFAAVHPLPLSTEDVPDELGSRLVVIPPTHAFARGKSISPAETRADQFLVSRGKAARVYRNTLVFLAADAVQLQDLEEAVGRYLAWNSIVEEQESLNLDPHSVRQAEAGRKRADETVSGQVPETWKWVLVPAQERDEDNPRWETMRLSGSGTLASRVANRLIRDDALVKKLASTTLRREMDEVPLWRDENHVAVRQLVEDFASYLYLERLTGPEVLAAAASAGVGSMAWREETFAYAESHDEETGRYRGLVSGQAVSIDKDDPGLLVMPSAAIAQVREDSDVDDEKKEGRDSDDDAVAEERAPYGDTATRFFGSVELDADRASRDFGKVAEEVLHHLTNLPKANVTVSVEIQAETPEGMKGNTRRVLDENCRTLKFRAHGFETD